MFSRVLKYEFAAWRRSYTRFLAVIGLILVLGCIAVALRLPVVSELAVILPVLATLALPISQFVLVVISYYRSLYGPRGYLTHTLPVHAGMLYAGKLVAAMVEIIISVLLMLVGFALTTLAIDVMIRTTPFTGIRTILHGLGQVRGLGGWALGLGLLLLLSLTVNVIGIFFAISIGSEARWQGLGIGGPVLVYVLLYVVMQLTSLGLMVVVPLGLQVDMRPTLLAEMSDRFALPQLSIVTGNMLMTFWNALREPNAAVATIGLGSFFATPLAGLICAWQTVRSIRWRTSLR